MSKSFQKDYIKKIPSLWYAFEFRIANSARSELCQRLSSFFIGFFLVKQAKNYWLSSRRVKSEQKVIPWEGIVSCVLPGVYRGKKGARDPDAESCSSYL